MSNQLVSLDGDGDAKRYPHDVRQTIETEHFHEGKDAHAHKALDSKDQRSIKNKLAAYEHDEHAEHHTTPKAHYKEHEKKGAVIDEELAVEDKETIERMEDAKRQHLKHDHHHHTAHHK